MCLLEWANALRCAAVTVAVRSTSDDTCAAQHSPNAALRDGGGTALLCSALLCTALHCTAGSARRVLSDHPATHADPNVRPVVPRPQRMRLLTTAYTAWTHCVRTLVFAPLGGTLASLAARQDVPHIDQPYYGCSSACDNRGQRSRRSDDSLALMGARVLTGTRVLTGNLGYSGTHGYSGTLRYSGTHCR